MFVVGIFVGAGPSLLAVFSGADRFGGFSELSLEDPAVVTYGVKPGSQVVVRLANYDYGTRRYEWELRLDDEMRLVESGSLLLAPGRTATVPLMMPAIDATVPSTWISFHVLGLPQQLRWKLQTETPVQGAPSLPSGLERRAAVPDAVPDVEPGNDTSSDIESDIESGIESAPPDESNSGTVSADAVAPPASVDRLDALPDEHRAGLYALPALPSTVPAPQVHRPYLRIDSLDPLRPEPVYVDQFVAFTVFFAPHSAKLDQASLADVAAFVAPAFAGRNLRVFCDGYTQYGSAHGADVRLSERRAKNVCAAIAALGLEAEFVPVGHGRADFQGDAARFVSVRLEFEVLPSPGAASLVPAHG